VLAVLAMPFGLETPFLLTMGWSIDRMLDLAAIVSAWSTHLRASPLLTPLSLAIGLAALAWFSVFKDRWRLLGPLVAVPAVILFALDVRPDVLIADTTRAVAIRGPSGLELADGKPQSFALGVWRETYAEPITAAASVNCDSIACIGQSSVGFSYAIIRDPAGFADECDRDLIIARISAPNWCRAGTIIDAGDLYGHGVHWLRWNVDDRRFEVRPAIGSLDRDWRIKP
jgi:competence protein ComEC